VIILNLGNRWGEWSASLPGRLTPKELSLVTHRDKRFQRVLHHSSIKILYMHKVNFPITFVVFILCVHILDTTTGQDSINSNIFIVLYKFWIMELNKLRIMTTIVKSYWIPYNEHNCTISYIIVKVFVILV